jgi:Leucine-rich repeat (LRR) protein
MGRAVDVSVNSISGTIPKQLSALARLEELFLNDNKLTGNIPTLFTQLSSLTALDLTNNALSKAISTTLGVWGARVGSGVG